MHNIPFTALECDSGQVDVVRRFGGTVYFGDPIRLDVLRAAGIEQAKLPIVVLDHMEDVVRSVEVAKRNFPHLTILARARNRRHAHLLMDRGVDGLVRDTFHSSLKLAELSLTALGIEPDAAAHAIYADEKHLIQNTQHAAEELASLFEVDRK
jgi:voltage-gated potassium channel Kch